jgi:DNA-3-methyladenine glycosylase I
VPTGSHAARRGLSDPLYVDYHDTEWGRPVHDEHGLFERVSLEAFQSGLSWLTILRKRPAFRSAFAEFEIDATIGNARVLIELDRPLSELLWSFAPEPRSRPLTSADVPAVTPESTAMAKSLRRLGFRFVGPTTAYALMQATGMVDDHLDGCHVPA